VSILFGIGATSVRSGAKVSITIMRPPQRGQGKVAPVACRWHIRRLLGSAAGGATLKVHGLSRCSQRGLRWQEAVVANAVEAAWKHVNQETPDELVREAASSSSDRAVEAIILPSERNRAVVGCNEAAVRDCDAMV